MSIGVDNKPDNVRVALWCCQRSMSTLFERCIAAGGDVEIFHEVYLAAYRFGPEHADEIASFDTDDSYTFENVHKMLGQKFPPGSAVFLKDMAFAVEGRFSEHVSSKFCHTFLIRSPRKVIRSYLRLLQGCDFDENYVSELRRKLPNSFRQQCLLYDFLMERSYQSHMMVIDADDFLAMSEAVLRRYCQDTGLTFRECMLSWKSLDSIPDDWHCSEVLKTSTEETRSYDRALRSTGIEPPDQRSAEGSAEKRLDLPLDWKKCKDECEEFYKIMFERRTIF